MSSIFASYIAPTSLLCLCTPPQLCLNPALSFTAFEQLKKNVDRIRGKLRINIFCGTKDPGHLVSIRDFHQALLELDVDHTYLEIEDMNHDRKATMKLYSKIWFDYHVESLRRSGGLE